jgi:hypothetical protein
MKNKVIISQKKLIWNGPISEVMTLYHDHLQKIESIDYIILKEFIRALEYNRDDTTKSMCLWGLKTKFTKGLSTIHVEELLKEIEPKISEISE